MRRPGPLALLLTLVALVAPRSSTAQEPGKVPGLGAFAPFIGAWGPHPDSPWLERNPDAADDVAFLFEWTAPDRKLLRFYEGIPDGERDRRILESLVAADPRTGELLMLGYQARNDFLYRGAFEVDSDGFVRLYDVTYPPDQEFRDPRDAERGIISYRDVCRLLDADTLECTTERRRVGAWEPWGSGGAYRLVRLPAGRRP